MSDAFKWTLGVPGRGQSIFAVRENYRLAASCQDWAPLAALTKFVPMSQILFGTDYPAEPVDTTIEQLARFGLSAKELQAIDRGNAERLFPRLKA